MKEKGYAYAIIGSAGPKDFYRKAVGAIGIEAPSPAHTATWSAQSDGRG